MQKLRFRREDLYPSYVAHIVNVMHDAGYDIHPKDAQDAWQAYSDSYNVTWLNLDGYTFQEIVSTVLYYCDEVEAEQ